MLLQWKLRVLSIGISFALSALLPTSKFSPKALILLQPRGQRFFVPSINCFTHSPQRNALYMVLVAGDKHWGSESRSSSHLAALVLSVPFLSHYIFNVASIGLTKPGTNVGTRCAVLC